MDLPVELQDIFSTLLGKTTISSWSLFKNNGLTTLNIRFNNYGQNQVQECKYRKVSEKQQLRNSMRSRQHKSNITVSATGVQTRSQSKKDSISHKLTEDKELPRLDSVSSNAGSHIGTLCHAPLTPIKTRNDSDKNTADLNVSLSSSHSVVEEAQPERPEHYECLEMSTVTEMFQPDSIPPTSLESLDETDSDSSEVSLPSDKQQREMNTSERAVEMAPDTNGNGICVYTDAKPKRRHYKSHYNQKVCRYCHYPKEHLVCYSCTKTHDKQRKKLFPCQLSCVPFNFKPDY